MGECSANEYDIDDTDIAGRGMNVLHLAVHCIDVNKTKEMVKKLAKKGKLENALAKVSDYGQTPLEFADERMNTLEKDEKEYSEELASVLTRTHQLKTRLVHAKKNKKNLEKIRETLKVTSGGKRLANKTIKRHR